MLVEFSCVKCRIRQRRDTAAAGQCLRCRPLRLRIHHGQRVCARCESFDGQQCSQRDGVCVEKVALGKQTCPLGRHQLPIVRPPVSSQFRRGRVGFLAVAYMPIGGTEVWHQTLLPLLSDVSGFVVLEPSLSGGDPTKLGCRFGVGMAAAQQLAANVDVLVSWGVGARLGEVVRRSRPKVISVSHCDDRSDWTIEMMAAQAPWTDQAVYLCPSGANTCPPGVPSQWIPNAPSPNRIIATQSRNANRKALGIGDGEIMLASVSRLSPEKGVDKLIGAIDCLPERFRLVIAGTSAGWSADHGNELRRLAGPRVSFVGNVDPPADLLSAADAFLSASQYEGYGLSMAEALAAGVPLIATQTGFLETFPSYARLVPHDATPATWAESIRRDFQQPQKQHLRTHNAKLPTVHDFARDWDRLIDRMRSEKE